MNQLEFSTPGRRWRVDLRSPFDLAIRVEFGGLQPRFFAEQGADAVALTVGRFSGEVRRGASCNCSVYTFAPHCHGTHTECVGHLTADATHVAALTPVPPALALVLTVQPGERGAVSQDSSAVSAPTDLVITGAMLDGAAQRWTTDPWTALVVRTLPNDAGKAHRLYAGPCPAPYFTVDAMHWIVQRAVTSLVVDLPSLDRADDGGALLAHRTYWGLAPGATEARHAQRGRALVTELAFVPESVVDGLYLLDLQVPAFGADAAPSRPVIYPVAEILP